MSQHDETKRMLGLIRESNTKITNTTKKMLREQVEGTTDSKELDPAELSEEEGKFRDTVTPKTKFTSFKLYPKAQNVEFSGEFNDSKIEWFYSLDDTRGVYITGTFIQLNDEVLKQIQGLVAYYETWSNEWATRIAEEYKNEIAAEENTEEGPESIESTEFGEEEFAEGGTEEEPIENV
tara:strand:+ start:4812 stop:5348 length:537 start_codon:yes stop_codon:yes gene_type:complete